MPQDCMDELTGGLKLVRCHKKIAMALAGVRQGDQKKLKTLRIEYCCLIIVQTVLLVNRPSEAGFHLDGD